MSRCLLFTYASGMRVGYGRVSTSDQNIDGQRDALTAASRWQVERTFAWLHANRRLATRYERRADIHKAFLTLANALICLDALNRPAPTPTAFR